MKVKFFGTVRNATRTSEITFEGAEIDAVELFERLIEMYGNSFKETIIVDGKLNELILIVVNGQLVPANQLYHVRLKPNDTVTIMPLAAGG